jgi:hypothetical protein
MQILLRRLQPYSCQQQLQGAINRKMNSNFREDEIQRQPWSNPYFRDIHMNHGVYSKCLPPICCHWVWSSHELVMFLGKVVLYGCGKAMGKRLLTTWLDMHLEGNTLYLSPHRPAPFPMP